MAYIAMAYASMTYIEIWVGTATRFSRRPRTRNSSHKHAVLVPFFLQRVALSSRRDGGGGVYNVVLMGPQMIFTSHTHIAALTASPPRVLSIFFVGILQYSAGSVSSSCAMLPIIFTSCMLLSLCPRWR